MLRPSRSVAGFCIAVVVLAAFLPGICALDAVLFEPLWVLLPDEVSIAVDRPVTPCEEQPAPLLSLLASRAPPVSPFV